MEAAARRRVHRAWHIATWKLPRTMAMRIGPRNRRQQRARVGMARLREQHVLRRYLDDLPEIHHRHAVRHVLHHRQIVRDEQIRQTQPRLQVLQQIDHLRLDRHIERGHRFIAHHQRRLDGKRARDADALALPAGELMRISLRMVRCQPDQSEQLVHPRTPCHAVADTVHDQRLLQDLAHGHARVQRGKRILEYDLHPTAQTAQRIAAAAR